MAGIYIHIPFCKQKCTYCDFHFSTNLKLKNELVNAICSEIKLRKLEIKEPIETIYFGGGTPSILSIQDLSQIFKVLEQNFQIIEQPEITIETNPDDLTKDYIKQLKSLPINRFSIGVQSFFEEDLKFMHRAHDANQALNSIKNVQDAGFDNITIDLIYGGQTTSDDQWYKNLEIAVNSQVPHISSYALTVEPKTALAKQIANQNVEDIDETKQERHFKILCETLQQNGFIQYEISNFGKENYFSQHNSNYWKGKLYLGIGPSAHSFDGQSRSWNIANNSLYIKKIAQNIIPQEIEALSKEDRFNELIMIGLRTIYGVDLELIKSKFGTQYYQHLVSETKQLIEDGFMAQTQSKLTLTDQGKFLADGIASKLFILKD